MLQQLQKMINSQQNSEDQQGFIVAKGTAKLSEFDDIRDSKGKECKPFSSFYLPSGQGTMRQNMKKTSRLQLPESLESIDEFFIDQQCQSEPLSPSKLSRPKGVTRNNSITASLEHPYRFYAQSPAFQLVYSKNSSQDPLANDFQYIRNEIILQTAEIKGKEQKDQIEFKKHQIINKLRNPYSRLLRSFQYPQSGQNQKNSSIRTSDNSTKANSDLLQFDSRFQSGNLYCAYNKVGTNEYHMFVQNDTNSYGYNQWFYFSLFNIKKDIEYTFVIVNFKKKHSFFRYGYKPIIFSNKKYQQNDNKNGWYRGGSNIQYQESHITTSKFFKFYKLSFTLKFQYQNDYTLIAANLPYSFSKLSNFIQTFAKQFKQSNEYDEIATLKIGSLGRTFCGNNVPEIKISPNIQQSRQSKSPTKKRKNKQKVNKMIIFMARQHPGQTVSSFLMQKVLNQLSDFGPEFKGQEQIPLYTQTRQRIRYILKNYTIIIFPMINIDGVIYGNSRCDVTGMDLNRRWKNPSKIFHPQICNIKNKIQHYAKKYEIVGCFDLHGHSKMYNVFCYSCKIDRVTCRILPYLISKQTNIFNFPSCTFGITRYKSTTARACMFKTIRNQNVLTIQSSYFGYTEQQQNNIRESKKKMIKYFQPKTFQQIAKGILQGLSIFLNKDTEKVYVEVQKQIKQNLTQILSYEKTQEENDVQGSGSQTDPEGDQIDFETKINSILGKQFLQQAQCFMPAEEQNIDISALINPSKSSMLQSELVKRLSTKQHEETELNAQTIVEPKSSQIINKIRITKQRNQLLNKKNPSNQKFRSQLNFINTSSSKSSKPKQKPKKQTISYSFQRSLTSNKDSVLGDKQKQENLNKRFSSTQHQRAANVTERLYSQHNNQRLMFGSKKFSQLRIHDQGSSEEAEKVHSPKVYDDLIIYSAQSKEMLNYQKSNLLQRPSNTSYPNFQQPQFFLKFQKFFPSHVGNTFNRKEKLSFLQESIYKDDQKQILNTLLQNKKRLQIQKLRREKEKSTSIAERYNGNIKNHESIQQRQKTDKTLPLNGIVGRKKQQIVDFRRFKDRERLKIQLRQANQAFTKYIKRDGNY